MSRGKITEEAFQARLPQRFFSKVREMDAPRPGMDTPCWEWQGKRFPNGYGDFTMRRKDTLAHRVAYLLATGVAPGDSLVLHRCDNPPCVRPEHLFLGSYRDNNQDCKAKGRQRPCRGEASSRTRLSDADVLQMRADYAQGVCNQAALATRYGISRKQVSTILSRKQWTHI